MQSLFILNLLEGFSCALGVFPVRPLPPSGSGSQSCVFLVRKITQIRTFPYFRDSCIFPLCNIYNGLLKICFWWLNLWCLCCIIRRFHSVALLYLVYRLRLIVALFSYTWHIKTTILIE